MLEEPPMKNGEICSRLLLLRLDPVTQAAGKQDKALDVSLQRQRFKD